MPTKSEILNWRTDHLGAAAKTWGDQATQLDTAVNGAQGLLDGLQGSGQFVEAFRTRLKSYIDKTRPKVDKLKSAKQVAESSEQQLKGAKDKAVYAVHDPEDEDFNVNEDLSVTERRSHSGLDRLKRAIRRRWLQGILHTRAQELVATDNAIARKLHEIAQDLSNFHLEGPDGNTDFSGDPNHPKIMGPAKPLGPIEQEDYDLGYTFLDENGNPLPMLDENGNVVIDPKTGRPVPDSVWGDPADNNADGSPRVPHPPRDHHFADMDANDPYRTLPTGTTVGPNGERIALVSRPPDDPAWAENQTKNGKSVYVTQTEAYDVTRQPPQSLGKLQGVDGSKVYQGSIVYDKASGRMYVVGNHGDGSGDTARGMWRSDPVDPNHPNDWVKTLRYQGDVPSLPGSRESSLVALQHGGVALFGADDYRPAEGRNMAVGAISAATPEGLLQARPVTDLLPAGKTPWPGGAPYAALPTGVHWDPALHADVVDTRVSIWRDVPGVRGAYPPVTYQTSVPIFQPNS